MKCTKKQILIMVLLTACVLFLTNCDASNGSQKGEEVVKNNETTKTEEVVNDDGTIDTKEVAEDNEASMPKSLSEEEEKLKEILIDIRTKKYAIDESTDVDYIIEEMIKYIGTTDSTLRDDLIYLTFDNWLFKLESNQVKNVLASLLAEDKLKYKVGEEGTDSVFTRSFSVLVIDSILRYNVNGKYLTDDDIINVHNEIMDYMSKEKDHRGRVGKKGWAHAVAHSGDALRTLAKYEVIGKEELKEMLEAIKSKAVIDSYEYTDGEEGRLIDAIKSILSRQLIDDESLKEWVGSIIDYEKTANGNTIIQSNVKDFLKSLYYATKYMEEGKVVGPMIEEFLQENK
ncbi:DUF2785 domain-containing protein [Wukongibacter baidiensis]|uniref:DUF2785 domain-containing protein n=1 Tax=Wukongibacter baidiensis TaxID=1723361 RepID=UPI003D7FF24F